MMSKINNHSISSTNNAWLELKDEFPERIKDVDVYTLKTTFSGGNGRVYIAPNAHNILIKEKSGVNEVLVDNITKNVTEHGVNDTKRTNASTLRDTYSLSFVTGNSLFTSTNEAKMLVIKDEDNVDVPLASSQLHLINQQASTNPDSMLGKIPRTPFLQFGTTVDFDSFINVNNATYTFIDEQIPRKKIKKISVKTDNTTLLHKIRAKGVNSKGVDTDIDLLVDNSAKNKIPFIFRPVDTENGKLLINSHWLDYSQTLPLNEAGKFNIVSGLSIENYFNNNDVADMVADCIKLTQAYKTNFIDFRYTQAEWNALSTAQKNSVHAGDIKGDSTIGGMSVYGLAGKDPKMAVNSILTTFISKNPSVSEDKKLMKKIRRFLTATSQYNHTVYSIGADTHYHKAYLPWYLEAVTQVDTLITRTLPFKVMSEYFDIAPSTNKLTPKDTVISMSKAKIFELDREMSEPVMSATIAPTNRSPLPSDLDLNTNEGMEYLIWLPFHNDTMATTFFETTENSVTKTYTITNSYPNTNYQFVGDSNPYQPSRIVNGYRKGQNVKSLSPSNINGVPIELKDIRSKQDLEIEVLASLGKTLQDLPTGWTFSATLSPEQTTSADTSWFSININNPRDANAGGGVIQGLKVVRWENISYTYSNIVTQGELVDKQYVYDKQDIINNFQTYTGEQGVWEADITKDDVEAFTELTVKHYFGDTIGLKLTFMDDTEYEINDIPLKSTRNEAIGETIINF